MQAAGNPASGGLDPESRGPDEPQPSGESEVLGPSDLQFRNLAWRTKENWAQLLGFGPSRSLSTTSAKSSMRQGLGILRCISSFTLFLLHPGNYAIISKLTGLLW